MITNFKAIISICSGIFIIVLLFPPHEIWWNKPGTSVLTVKDEPMSFSMPTIWQKAGPGFRNIDGQFMVFFQSPRVRFRFFLQTSGLVRRVGFEDTNIITVLRKDLFFMEFLSLILLTIMLVYYREQTLSQSPDEPAL